MTDKESLTHEIEDDLAARNRNWNKVDRNTTNITENTTNLDDHMLKTAEDNAHGLANAVIVESGSNERGRYVKYGDGTMICTHDFPIEGITMTQASSGLYYALLSEMTFPAPFIEAPYVRVDIHAQEYIGSGNRSLYEATFQPRIYTISDISTATRMVRYFAIGQWK